MNEGSKSKIDQRRAPARGDHTAIVLVDFLLAIAE
jgi:hypothetical protein